MGRWKLVAALAFVLATMVSPVWAGEGGLPGVSEPASKMPEGLANFEKYWTHAEAKKMAANIGTALKSGSVAAVEFRLQSMWMMSEKGDKTHLKHLQVEVLLHRHEGDSAPVNKGAFSLWSGQGAVWSKFNESSYRVPEAQLTEHGSVFYAKPGFKPPAVSGPVEVHDEKDFVAAFDRAIDTHYGLDKTVPNPQEGKSELYVRTYGIEGVCHQGARRFLSGLIGKKSTASYFKSVRGGFTRLSPVLWGARGGRAPVPQAARAALALRDKWNGMRDKFAGPRGGDGAARGTTGGQGNVTAGALVARR